MEPKYAASWESTRGPGDSRPTALQIVNDEDLSGKLGGKVIFITGCSSGIGIETARALKATGAKLFLTARNLEKGKQALAGILEAGSVELLHLDLESLESVRACVRELHGKTKTLNILINNAGVRNTPKGRTKDGFETQFGTNHVAHFLLFQLLKSMLLASSTPDFHSRVVAVSSTGHREFRLDFDDLNQEKRVYNPRVGYAQSKLANIYMANEIEKHYGSKGLHGWSVHPGGIQTGLQRKNMYFLSDMAMIFKLGLRATQKHMQSAEQGASTTVWAAISKDLEGKGGKYLERCRVSLPVERPYNALDPGHELYVYDEEDAKRCWVETMKMVGLDGEDN